MCFLLFTVPFGGDNRIRGIKVTMRTQKLGVPPTEIELMTFLLRILYLKAKGHLLNSCEK